MAAASGRCVGEQPAGRVANRRERDLGTARQVQLHFLPQRPPAVPGYEFFDYYLAADEVGGDYFGYVPLPDGRLAVAVGDVEGKGVAAALLIANFTEVRFCLTSSSSPRRPSSSSTAIWPLKISVIDSSPSCCASSIRPRTA